MITENEYQTLKQKYEFYHSERQRIFPGKNCFTLEMQAQLPESPTSDEISSIEVYEFITNPPTKYTAYVNDKKGIVTTWTGESLGEIKVKQVYRTETGIKKMQVWFIGINNKKYYGVFPCDDQECCNFKIAK